LLDGALLGSNSALHLIHKKNGRAPAAAFKAEKCPSQSTTKKTTWKNIPTPCVTLSKITTLQEINAGHATKYCQAIARL
jgi:hypothetical protein